MYVRGQTIVVGGSQLVPPHHLTTQIWGDQPWMHNWVCGELQVHTTASTGEGVFFVSRLPEPGLEGAFIALGGLDFSVLIQRATWGTVKHKTTYLLIIVQPVRSPSIIQPHPQKPFGCLCGCNQKGEKERKWWPRPHFISVSDPQHDNTCAFLPSSLLVLHLFCCIEVLQALGECSARVSRAAGLGGTQSPALPPRPVPLWLRLSWLPQGFHCCRKSMGSNLLYYC